MRRDQDLNVTLLSVENGDLIEPKAAVATTQVLTKTSARVQLSKSDERRILLITADQQIPQQIKGNATVKEGDLVKNGEPLSKMTPASHSGQVVAMVPHEVTVRKGRPYLISASTQLQSEDGALVQRGDLLATLIFERQKTGDIVQGLPRVEELLEARKPKESAILSEKAGKARIVAERRRYYPLVHCL